MNMNKVACHCHNVTYKKIAAAIADGARTYEEVQKATHCGTGCGKCKDFIQVLIRDLLEEQNRA